MKIRVSLKVSNIINEFYTQDHEIAADDLEVRFIQAQHFVPPASESNDDESGSEGCYTDQDEGHFMVEISRRVTFLRVVSLVKMGMSYKQVAGVIEKFRLGFTVVASTHRAVNRRQASQFIRKKSPQSS